MPAFVPSAFVQNINKTNDIGIDVSVGICERIANIRIRSQVNDAFATIRTKQEFCCPPIREINLAEPKVWIVLKCGQTRTL